MQSFELEEGGSNASGLFKPLSLSPLILCMPFSTENEQALFNINCKVQPLLESMKHCCGCESEGTEAICGFRGS